MPCCETAYTRGMGISLGMPAVAPPRPLPGSPDTAAPGAPAPENLDGLVDRFGRRASDMRLSLTDKCNLRCTYCMPASGLDWLPKDKVLTAAEIIRLVGIGVDGLGVRELRLTGGEPLVRADLVEIVAGIRANHPDLPVSLTTNGLGLDKKAQRLKRSEERRVGKECPV